MTAVCSIVFNDRFNTTLESEDRHSNCVLQVQQLDILQGCSRWTLHNDPAANSSTSLIMRFDAYLQLNVEIDSQADGGPSSKAELRLAPTPEGMLSSH